MRVYKHKSKYKVKVNNTKKKQQQKFNSLHYTEKKVEEKPHNKKKQDKLHLNKCWSVYVWMRIYTDKSTNMVACVCALFTKELFPDMPKILAKPASWGATQM